MANLNVTKFRPCVLLFVCLLALPLLWSWVSCLFMAKHVVVDLKGLDFPGLYKEAVRQSDGSIDLVINIPASAHLLANLHRLQNEIRDNQTRQSRGEPPAKRSDEWYKTAYPVTLNSPYIINSPDLCQGVQPLHVLVIVHTSTTNFQRRRLIRETWASPHVMTTRSLRLLFVLGQTANSNTQRMIENERLVYGDLIQGQFQDTYHNLTHKGVLAYRWIHEHCPHAQLILKADDDMYVNPFLLYELYFAKFSNSRRTIACHVRPRNTSPVIRSHSKWNVQEYDFRGYKFYPFPYCNGYVVIITPDIITALFKAAHVTPFFWVDDVYLYGMLASRVGRVKHENIRKSMTLDAQKGLQCYKQPPCKLLASRAPEESVLSEVWRLSLAQISSTIRPQINPVYLIT